MVGQDISAYWLIANGYHIARLGNFYLMVEPWGAPDVAMWTFSVLEHTPFGMLTHVYCGADDKRPEDNKIQMLSTLNDAKRSAITWLDCHLS